MTASHGTFHDKAIGHVAEVPQPLLGKNGRSPGRRDYRNQFGFKLFLLFFAQLKQMRGQIRRQAGAGEDDVNAVFDGGANELAEVGQGDHDVGAEQAGRLGARLLDFLFHGADVGARGILGHVGIEHADHGTGDDADAAFVGDCRGQPRQGYADAHAALDDGDAGG